MLLVYVRFAAVLFDDFGEQFDEQVGFRSIEFAVAGALRLPTPEKIAVIGVNDVRERAVGEPVGGRGMTRLTCPLREGGDPALALQIRLTRPPNAVNQD